MLAVNGLNYIERDITAHLQRVMKLFPVVLDRRVRQR